ncbi:MAG: TonB-dependent receptor, plug [Phenylobacterium sp.]|nr:TonB-dependent receptor, plug [Phenylobacterium sp.]
MKSLTLRLAIGCIATLATAGASRAEDLTSLSLEDLIAQQVTSVAKRPQNVQEAPAAVFVIGREDIRRSGATTLPDLLRMVPGVEVATLSGGQSAVSARGFNGAISNKLLVLIDGRAVYLSAISGVTWDQQLVPVEVIERIEVVRGPGAALWGANAVTGVINVITKHAIDSLGGWAKVEVDSERGGRVFIRQGFRVGETGALRLYGVAHRDTADGVMGTTLTQDRVRNGQIGFRFNAEPTERDALTFQGDAEKNSTALTTAAASQTPGGIDLSNGRSANQNLLGRWTRTRSDRERTSLQVYFDRATRAQAGATLERLLFDVDFSNQFQIGERHDLVWGFDYRRSVNRFGGSGAIQFIDSKQNLYSGFVQDDISLVPKRLTLSLGAKLEHNAKTGVEFQPTVRAIWTDPAGWSLWAAASRAARTPSEFETDSSIDLRPYPLVVIPGKASSEKLTAYEIGWRGRITPVVTLDITAFHNRYTDLIVLGGAPALLDGAPVLRFSAANLVKARAYGVEASLDARLKAWWTVKAAASWLDVKTAPITVPYFAFSTLGDDKSPRTQVSVRSMMDLGDSVDLDLWLRHVAALGDHLTPAYTNLDLRLAWRPTPKLELSLRGTNLLGRKASEMRTDVTGSFASIPAALPSRRVSITASVRY